LTVGCTVGLCRFESPGLPVSGGGGGGGYGCFGRFLKRLACSRRSLPGNCTSFSYQALTVGCTVGLCRFESPGLPVSIGGCSCRGKTCRFLEPRPSSLVFRSGVDGRLYGGTWPFHRPSVVAFSDGALTVRSAGRLYGGTWPFRVPRSWPTFSDGALTVRSDGRLYGGT
jgi:hypothetical protein